LLSNFSEGYNYLVVPIIIKPSGPTPTLLQLTFTGAGYASNNQGIISGIQIEAVPESPVSLLLSAGGILTIIYLKKRSKKEVSVV
jgi:hypothetical protein